MCYQTTRRQSVGSNCFDKKSGKKGLHAPRQHVASGRKKRKRRGKTEKREEKLKKTEEKLKKTGKKSSQKPDSVTAEEKEKSKNTKKGD